jgi:hypothetical protein
MARQHIVPVAEEGHVMAALLQEQEATEAGEMDLKVKALLGQPILGVVAVGLSAPAQIIPVEPVDLELLFFVI